LEELRVVDYNQGRKFGNASGQPGAFGTTNFGTNSGGMVGGFGNTKSTNLFGGSGTNTSTGFGGGTGGFGGSNTNTGGGLFGSASKPTSVFGSTATANPKPAGGLFGNTTGSGFGGTSNTGTGFGGAGTSLFGGGGSNNNTSTGADFAFGSGGTTGGFGQNPSGGFGSGNTSSGTNLFGSTTTTAPFGGQQTQTTGGSNLFGGFGGQQPQQSSQPPQTSSLFGGGFGSNQPKTGGLFGGSNNTATAGGGLFGSSNPQPAQPSTGGLFGSSNQNQTGGGLFGGAKPGSTTTGTTGTGLFGGGQSNTTGGGPFGGGAQAQQPAGGSIFGGGAAQSKPGGLFGGLGNSNSNTGAGLFGSSTNNNQQQQPGSSLFPSLSTNQGQPNQPGSSLFGSTINGSQQTNPQALHQQGLQASLTDINSFGDSQGFFSGISNLPDVGPLATPLSSSQKQKKSTLLPAYRTNPASASRLLTPVRQGYGLQYSRYGTPGSAFSSAASTPAGLSSSLLRNSFSKNLGKSLSTSNLRHTYEADESVLAPGAFTPSGRRMNSGIKTLHINRGLRGDLFGTPTPAEQPKALTSPEKNDIAPLGRSIRKRVSFDADVSGGMSDGQSNGSTPSAQEQGFLRSSKNMNGGTGSRSAGSSKSSSARPGESQPEMEQVRGNELAVVHEDDPNPVNHLKQPVGPANSQDDLQIGDYWMRPTREALGRLSPDKLKKVEDFIVGRQGCGHVKFNRPVDLSSLKLDHIPDDVVHITTRAITVYPIASQKPPQGKGLNVPSTIALQNSWPRAKGGKDKIFDRNGPKFNKHVERLKRVTDTEFISYDRDTGVWTFTVQHFTTYGLEYDDETDGEELNQSTFSLPDSPTPAPRRPNGNGNPTPRSYAQQSTGQKSSVQSDLPSETDSPQVDDTFRFKTRNLQNVRGVPGAFDDEVMADETACESEDQSFLDERSVGSPRLDGDDGLSDIHDVADGENDESVMDEEEDPASLDPQLDHTSEPENSQNSLMLSTRADPFVAPTPKSILKNTTSRRRMSFGTPTKVNLDLDADWAEQLQRTISPKKQDRVALRQNQDVLLQLDDLEAAPQADHSMPADGNEFRNSMDLMNSLWGKESGRKSGKGKRGLESGRGIQV
jgi:nuclear pore complex protein Nup98-Nup96